MNSKIVQLSLVFLLANAVGGADPPNNRNKIENILRKFSARFLHEVLQKESDKNIMVNMVSLQLNLLLAAYASSQDSRIEILTALALKDQSDENILMYVKDLLELQSKYNRRAGVDIFSYVYMTGYEFSDAFKELARDIFKIICDDKGNFEIPRLNRIVKQFTNNNFHQFLRDKDLPYRTFAVLVDNLFISAPIGYVYDDIKIRKRVFYNYGRFTKYEISMMQMNGIFRYADLPKYEASCLIIPLENDNVEVMIVLPNEKEGLQTMDALLATSNVNRLNFSMEHRRVELTMPRMKARYNTRYKEYLEKLGILTPFTDDASIPYIFNDPLNPKIDMVRQLVDLKFDEDGIKMSSVSLYTYVRKDFRYKRETFVNTTLNANNVNESMWKAHRHRVRRNANAESKEVVKFTADHPFTFFIYSDRHLYLVGHYVAYQSTF